MILYSNGCSYTWGGTLFNHMQRSSPINKNAYCGAYTMDAEEDKKRLETVYPHHLSKLLNASKVINDGLGCGSNARIVRKTLEYFNNLIYAGEDVSDHFVTIQWTELSRTEKFYSGSWWQFMINSWLNESEVKDYIDEKKWHSDYYKHYDNDEQQIETFIEQVYCLGNFFKVHKIPYLFFTHSGVVASFLKESNSRYVKLNQNKIVNLLNRFTWYNNSVLHCSMFHSGIENCLPVGSHPNANGHIQWANKVYDYITEQKLL